MRKHIERRAVRRVSLDILALRRWSQKRADGSTIPGEAFGMAGTIEPVSGQVVTEYPFYIYVDGDHLKLVIDAYSASGRAAQAGDAWDVDQWDNEKIFVNAVPINRSSYQQLLRIAKLLLAGFDVRVLGTEIYIQGIPNAVRSETSRVLTLAEFLAAQRAANFVDDGGCHA